MELFKADKNMASVTTIEKDGLVFHSAESEPFRIYGVFKLDGGYFRMPPDAAISVSSGVGSLANNTAGGRVRFKTNSKRIAIIASRNTVYTPDHMTYVLIAGFDMYADGEYAGTFRPGNLSGEQTFESSLRFDSPGERVITIVFPAYGPVSDLMIGIDEGATLSSAPDYEYEKPMVFYGSSITQGGCASRPGMTYPDILSRSLSANYINLGFSGGAKGQDTMAEYIAGLDMSVFIYDYDRNAQSADHLENTHERMFLKIREKNPDLPIVMLTRTDYKHSTLREECRAVIKRTYDNAVARGDKNVYILYGSDIFGEVGNDGTVDGCHLTDLGFFCLARAVRPILAEILKK